uniref:Uncharacterized protein n=1 Tax=Amphilophus citrinellus TaxID=61819 RepID=A0A3Q0S6Y1_AMPCI
MVETWACMPVTGTGVFEWFGLHLNPAKRIEFLCGLLHMCQPLELRFLGSYLEDLARKDYHVLRDFEFRANSPSDLGMLTDVVDPVIRSKLLVCLSLLGSDSRECAGILFRILSHVNPALFYKNYDYPLPPFRDPHFALLFTMASLHPAFHFHQRQVLKINAQATVMSTKPTVAPLNSMLALANSHNFRLCSSAELVKGENKNIYIYR